MLVINRSIALWTSKVTHLTSAPRVWILLRESVGSTMTTLSEGENGNNKKHNYVFVVVVTHMIKIICLTINVTKIIVFEF